MHKAKGKLSHSSSIPAEGSRELELWYRNEETSPILRLPPEIRNRIYAEVLCVGQINVRYRRWRHTGRQQHGNGAARGGFYAVVLKADQNPWRYPVVETRQPFRDGGGLFLHGELTLLSGVCRQLHRETALLPFSLNAWSFENTYVMEKFVHTEKRLLLPQRRAICTLFVADNLSKFMENYFGGLQVLVWRDVDQGPANGGVKDRNARAPGARAARARLRWQVLEEEPAIAEQRRAARAEGDLRTQFYRDSTVSTCTSTRTIASPG